MKFTRYNTDDWFIQDTAVENVFTMEYLPSAPGNYVKVYLYGLTYSGLEMEITNESLAKDLGMDPEEVLSAWEYWETCGAVKRIPSPYGNPNEFDIEFKSLKAAAYGKNPMGSAGAPAKRMEKAPNAGASGGGDSGYPDSMGDSEYRSLYTAVEHIHGAPLSATEMSTLSGLLEDYRFTPELILYGYQYAKEKGKCNHKYVAKVLSNWIHEGLDTVEAVEASLESSENRFQQYRRVLKALGLNRMPTEEEQRKMDSWFDEMGFTMERVLDACGKTSSIPMPNVGYVNGILKNWYQRGQKFGSGVDGVGTRISEKDIDAYYSYLRKKAEDATAKLEKEVYAKLPEIALLEKQSRKLNIEISKLIFSKDKNADEKRQELSNKIKEISKKKRDILEKNGYPGDFSHVKYGCSLCGDTGIVENGQRCQCFAQRVREAEQWIKTNSMKKTQ